MEKLTFIIKSIVDIFLVQFKKNQFQNKRVLSIFLPAIFPPKNTKKTAKKTRFESYTWDIYNLSELLYFKTIQIDKYRNILYNVMITELTGDGLYITQLYDLFITYHM